MTALGYALLFGLAFGLLVGNYAAWAAYEFEVVNATFWGALVAIVVGFWLYVLLRRLSA